MPSRAFTLATVLGTDGNLNAQDVSGLAAVASTGSFSDVINKPTTTSGYGITDSSPTITSLVYAGNDLATDTTTPLAVTIIGTNFEASSNIYIDTISAANACTSLQYSGTTQITFTPPAKSAASYNVWLVGPSGKIAVLANGILYSGTPSWAGVATSYTTETNLVSIQLTAASTDTPVTYSLVSGTLPNGVTLSSTGLISGTTAITATTTYSNLVIRATDQQNQDANLTVSLTVTYIKPVTRSLRFNSADSAYLNRTPSVAGNRKTFTWSGWVKRSSISSTANALVCVGTNTSDDVNLSFRSEDTIDVLARVSSSIVLRLITTQVFRDVSAWYHVVLSIDTSQGTDTNRAKLYVNGTQVTAFSTATYPGLNQDLNWNNTVAHEIGRINNQFGAGSYFNGYLTEVNFIDGQALTPSSFGETNPQTGVWRPISYTGSYGTNGFYLEFSDNSAATASTLGKDYSGNNNNWTPNNFSVASGAGNDSLVDSPTSYGTDTGAGGEVRGNYATLNPLSIVANASLSNGNLDATNTSGSNYRTFVSTIAIPSGSWYCEFTAGVNTSGDNMFVGICPASAALSSTYIGSSATSYAYSSTGTKYNNASATSYGASFTNGDVIGVAFNGSTLTFYKNGTTQGNAFTSLSGDFVFALSLWGTAVCTVNFGQRPFAYSAPSGFKALCTQNLPTPTIGATTATQAGKYFNTILWTGNGSNPRAITGVGFQPDFSWLARRDVGYGNFLYDAVRGGANVLKSESTAASYTYQQLNTFDTDGFTQAGSVDQGNNSSGGSYVAWNWKANGSGSTNTAGTITSTVSANTTSGLSVVTYTNASSGTVGHGLGVAPAMVIYKDRTNVTNWVVLHQSLTNMSNYYLTLNTTNAVASGIVLGGSPTSSVIYTNTSIIQNSAASVAYCFAAIPGFSAFGSYTGNGSTDGPFVYTGFKPAYLLVKRSSIAGNNWQILDIKRSPYNVMGSYIYASASNAEAYDAIVGIDSISNGFKMRGTDTNINASGSTYIYMAFAETPFKYSLAR